MRIVHISVADDGGGAARAAYRLHCGLRRMGCDSQMLVGQKHTDDPDVIALKGPTNWFRRLQHRVSNAQIRRDFRAYRPTRGKGHEQFSDDRAATGSDLVRQIPPCDVVTLHWVGASMLDMRSFFGRVPLRTPVVWRLPDMHAFTGGCHYDEECGRFRQSCGACPQLGSSDENDLSRQIWRRKQAAFAALPRGRLHMVALNRWMADTIRSSSALGHVPISVIPNGIDTDAFAPRDTAYARSVLGIPQTARVVLFVAMSLNNRRKGFALLQEALAQMSDVPELYLVSIGKGAPPAPPGVAALALGSLGQSRLLSLVYSAADLFVIPSLQDNQPSTVLEALACGTPVVGFETGGIPEMVRPNQTGLLAPLGDVAGLRAAMTTLLTNPQLQADLSGRCRQVALKEYDQLIQARRYLQLYESLAVPEPLQVFRHKEQHMSEKLSEL